ncbi:MAG: maleylacetoacetate isomerase [Pseudomonadota bacterium]
MALKLYSYWRSSAAYRLRIALAFKGVAYETIAVNIAPGKNEQVGEDFRAINPQMRVPALEADGTVMTQSMAILEWLDEMYPEPSLLPGDAWLRQQIRTAADIIACDIHPLNNLSVLKALRQDIGATDDAVSHWYADWIHRGFAAIEKTAERSNGHKFLFGDTPTLAEICLVPQVYNARRFNVDLTAFPRLTEVDAACLELDAFKQAVPENQPDAT